MGGGGPSQCRDGDVLDDVTDTDLATGLLKGVGEMDDSGRVASEARDRATVARCGVGDAGSAPALEAEAELADLSCNEGAEEEPTGDAAS